MNLDLALDVSWRRVTGPQAIIRLSTYGPDARRTARKLGMEIVGPLAYITARTPDLAEATLVEASKPDAGPYVAEIQPHHAAIITAIDTWLQA